MFKLLLFVSFLIPSFAGAAHLATNLRCVDKNEISEMKLQFIVVKKNKLHRFKAEFKILKGEGFSAGDKVDVIVGGDQVASLKLKGGKGKFLKGSFRVQGFDPDFPIENIKRGKSASILDLNCKFKR